MKKIFALLALVVGMTTTSFANTSSTMPAASTSADLVQSTNNVIRVNTKAEMVALANQLTAKTTAKVVQQDICVIIIIFDDGSGVIIVGNC